MNTFLFIVLIIALIGLWLTVPQLMMRRAVGKVIRIFRQRYAVGQSNAKTLDELGLGQRGLERFVVRDYKPRALQVLTSANIIRHTEDGKLYLSEEDLQRTSLKG